MWVIRVVAFHVSDFAIGYCTISTVGSIVGELFVLFTIMQRIHLDQEIGSNRDHFRAISFTTFDSVTVHGCN